MTVFVGAQAALGDEDSLGNVIERMSEHIRRIDNLQNRGSPQRSPQDPALTTMNNQVTNSVASAKA